jgi:GT2 family glycosyltransferase
VRLSVCIVNWNTHDDLRACLRALETHPYMRGEQEILVVDNASADGSADMVRAEFPGVNLIANAANENYAHGTNQALAAATGDLILLLNPDVEVLPGALDRLAGALTADRKIGAVAARLMYPDGRTQPSVRGFPDPLPVLYDILGLARLFPKSRTFGAYRMTYFDYEQDGSAPQPMASCFMLTRQALEAVGPMDERFPLYFNDVDWCLRCRDAGLEILYLAGAKVLHGHGGTTRRVRKAAVWESHRALLRLYEKHYRKNTPRLLYALLTALITLGAWARTGRWGERLGRHGGETTPESLHRELEREGGSSRVSAQPDGSGAGSGDD